MSLFTLGMALLVLGTLIILGVLIRQHFRMIERSRRIYNRALKALSRDPTNETLEARCREQGKTYYRLTMAEDYSAMDQHIVVNPTWTQQGEEKVEEDIQNIKRSA